MDNIERKKKREFVVAVTRIVGYNIFESTSKTTASMMAKAHEKLLARYFLDHGVSLSNREKKSYETLFETINDDELNNLVKSAENLLRFYGYEVYEQY